MMAFLLCRVHDRASLGTYRHLLGVHLVLRQVLDLYAMEVAEATMKCDESRLDAFYLHTLEQFATEMQSCRRCCYGTFVLCEYGLEVLHVLACGTRGLRFPVSVINDIAWQRCLAQRIKLLFELVVRTVIKEAQRAAAACSVVDDLGNHRSTFVEEQLVAYSDFAGRLHKHVPKAHLLIKLTQEEHLNLCVGLLLRTVKARREYLCVVEYERVTLVKIVEHVTEINKIAFHGIAVSVFLIHIDGLRLLVQHHETALVASRHAERICRSVVTCNGMDR